VALGVRYGIALGQDGTLNGRLSQWWIQAVDSSKVEVSFDGICAPFTFEFLCRQVQKRLLQMFSRSWLYKDSSLGLE
jgi:hypothetical protein